MAPTLKTAKDIKVIVGCVAFIIEYFICPPEMVGMEKIGWSFLSFFGGYWAAHEIQITISRAAGARDGD